MSTKRKTIIILSCCAIVACAALLASLIITDNQEKQQERERQQYAGEMMQYINDIYDVFVESGDDRAYQIGLYKALSAYRDDYRSSGYESAEIDALFNLVLGNMMTDFIIAYNGMLDGVVKAATDTIIEKQEYVFNTRESIDDLNTRFLTVDMGSNAYGGAGASGVAGAPDISGTAAGREEKVKLFFELSDMQAAFSEDSYLDDFAGEVEEHIASLEGIRNTIDTEGIVAGASQAKSLYSEIDRLKDSYSRELDNKDYTNLLNKFDSTLDSMRMWFSNFYDSLFDEISGRQRANRDDTDTINSQIDDLLLLYDAIISDGIFGDGWYMCKDIEDLIDKYNQELEDIAERKAQEEREQSGGGNNIGGLPGGSTVDTSNPSVGNTPGASTDAPSNIYSLASEIVRLTNIERANYGLPALTNDNGLLNSSAIVRAIEAITSFSHTRPDGRSCFTVYTDAGGQYNYLGENIAHGFPTPEEAVQGWMDSEGHRENILRPDFTQLGVGVVQDSNGHYYYAQMFCG